MSAFMNVNDEFKAYMKRVEQVKLARKKLLVHFDDVNTDLELDYKFRQRIEGLSYEEKVQLSSSKDPRITSELFEQVGNSNIRDRMYIAFANMVETDDEIDDFWSLPLSWALEIAQDEDLLKLIENTNDENNENDSEK